MIKLTYKVNGGIWNAAMGTKVPRSLISSVSADGRSNNKLKLIRSNDK